MLTRLYVHADPELLARADGCPLRVWLEDNSVWTAGEVVIEGPSRLVHEPAGLETPDGHTLRVWIEVDGIVRFKGVEEVCSPQ